MSTVVVVPTYNERENLPALVEGIVSVLPQAHILVVDDASPDGTGELADILADAHTNLSVLHRPGKSGLGAAYIAGFQEALTRWPEVDYVIQMDADLSHDPTYLPSLLAAANDADLVVGSRYLRGVSIINWPFHRLLVSRIGTAYARAVTGLPLTDCTSGFKCWRAPCLRAIGLDDVRSNGYVFQVETSFRAARRGFVLREVPIVFYDRTRGESKLHLSIALEAVLRIARMGLERCLRRAASTSPTAPFPPPPG